MVPYAFSTMVDVGREIASYLRNKLCAPCGANLNAVCYGALANVQTSGAGILNSDSYHAPTVGCHY